MDELPPELQDRTEDGDVQRYEELGARAADVDADAGRHAREGEHREEPRRPQEEPREQAGRGQEQQRAAYDLERPVRRDRRAEQAGAERCETEAGDAVAPRRREEQERQSETRDRPADASEIDHRTITAARSE